MPVTTGVIADDFTGATDIASFMAEQGWRKARNRLMAMLAHLIRPTTPGRISDSAIRQICR